MASLKEVRNRIASVKSTQQITSAMKMVAASKLRKAQTGILTLRPYAQKQQLLLQKLSAGADVELPGGLSDKRETNRTLFVAFSSNRGLCGAFNSNVIKKTMNSVNEVNLLNKGSEAAIITIGRKATEFFERSELKPVASFDSVYDDLTVSNAADIADKLTEMFIQGKYDKIVLIYHQFKNAVVQKLITEQFLPVEPDSTDIKGNAVSDYIFEPSRDEILISLVPRILRTQLYKALLDSWASEQGARMTAMSQATDNASELLNELKLTYNKARQAAITNEILEIVSGAEALNKN